MRHLHISHNVGHLPPKILHNLCFSFPLGTAAVPREIETILIQNFGGKSCALWEMCKLRTLSPNHIIVFLILLLRKFIALFTWLLSQSDGREGENTFQQSVQSTPGNLNPL